MIIFYNYFKRIKNEIKYLIKKIVKIKLNKFLNGN